MAQINTYREHGQVAALGFRETLRVYVDGEYRGTVRQRMTGGEWAATPAAWQVDGAHTALHLPTRQHALAFVAPDAAETPRERTPRTMARTRTTDAQAAPEHAIGTEFRTTYKGVEYVVVVTADGYVINGGTHSGTVAPSLKRCTKLVTGNYCDSKGPQTDRVWGIGSAAPVTAEVAPPAPPPTAPIDTPAPSDKPKRQAKAKSDAAVDKALATVVAKVDDAVKATRSTRKATGPITKAAQVKSASKAKVSAAA